ncbi:MAG: hypothetical protein KUG65_05885 [Sphingomonadaceae bacterium]|nr:hypothetical protein [Sphingomonadaceae bacterium]
MNDLAPAPIRPVTRRAAYAGFVALCGLLLSACLLAPGEFASTLDIRKDGRFTFTYSGELHFVSPSEFSGGKNKSGNDEVFKPQPCSTSSGAERECSTAELDRQMRNWEERQKNKSTRKRGEAEQMTAVMGGKDMSDPQTAQEFARSLERQHGWRQVTHKGKGLFEVDYAITGTLTHDFTFPQMEGFPMANPFVQISLRKDGSARINAPGFSSGASAGPLKGLASMAAMDKSKSGKDKMPQLPEMDGTFVIDTDGRILANNTAEGPAEQAGSSRLSWTVNKRTETPPTALIGLTR